MREEDLDKRFVGDLTRLTLAEKTPFSNHATIAMPSVCGWSRSASLHLGSGRDTRGLKFVAESPLAPMDELCYSSVPRENDNEIK
jgi:hypothetical protein